MAADPTCIDGEPAVERLRPPDGIDTGDAEVIGDVDVLVVGAAADVDVVAVDVELGVEVPAVLVEEPVGGVVEVVELVPDDEPVVGVEDVDVVVSEIKSNASTWTQ